MRFEPDIDRGRLIEAVRTAYGVSARSIEFLPLGFGACYDLTATDRRYFLKVWPYARLGTPLAEAQLASLALSDAIGIHVPALGVPRPRPTLGGALHADLDGVPLALFDYLEGDAGTRWSLDTHAAIGRAFAALHGATALLAPLVSRRESFDVPWEADLRSTLARLATLAGAGPEARPGLLSARAWVHAHGADVDAQLARLHALTSRARALGGPFVLCHTDLHANNVLVDLEGGMHLLDWDDAKLAPPEHDLWASLWEPNGESGGLRACTEAYRDAGGVAPLHLEHFACYLLRRYLEDAAVCLRALASPDADPRDDDHWLEGLRGWGATRWSRLDATLEVVATALT